MKRNVFWLAALCLLMAMSAGCYRGGDDRLHMGSPVGKDSIVSRYEVSSTVVYDAARAVLIRNGSLTSDDRVTRTMSAKVDTRTVWVTIDDAEPRLTKVTVQARSKGGGTDVDLASEIDKQIYGEIIVHPER